VSIHGRATANEVKNAFQGIAMLQETVLKVYREHNETFEKRVGVNRSKRTLAIYQNGYKHLERFIDNKYRVTDLSFKQLNYSFIENYDYYLRVDCRMMPKTVLHNITCLRKIIRIANKRGIIGSDPFCGFSPERPKTCQ
jgi:hypothetical protein